MAKTVENAEERKKRILEIRDYVLEKKAKGEHFSTRSIAKYFNKNRFPISNNTVHTYLTALSKIDNYNYQIIKKHLEENKPKTINDEQTKIRVMRATKLLIENYTIEEISNILESTPDTIYRDLTIRLPKIESDKEVLSTVATTLRNHSLQNLKQNKPKK